MANTGAIDFDKVSNGKLLEAIIELQMRLAKAETRIEQLSMNAQAERNKIVYDYGQSSPVSFLSAFL